MNLLFPSMIKPGMTGTHEGKKFTVISHVEDGEEYCGEALHNDTRNKVWVDYEGRGKTVFAFPLIMSPEEWTKFFDQLPTP